MSQQVRPLWLPVVGHEGRYEVSDNGAVRSLPRPGESSKRSWPGVALRPWRTTYGYLAISLRAPGEKQTRLIHRLVLEAFVGSCPDGEQCRHLDGNPFNNSVSNLAWGTRVENAADRERHGHQLHGERNPVAKLTEASVRKIRSAYSDGVTQAALASAFQVDRSTIRKVISRKRWAHVGGDP